MCDCHACAAFDPSVVPVAQHPPYEKFTAIWDTGATNSVITKHVVDACGLKPTGMTQVRGVHGVKACETYLINIKLISDVSFSDVAVTLADDLAGGDLLIGMDIITMGDFSITNVGQRTVFSFRVPSIRSVDFVKEFNAQQFSHGGGGGKKHKHKKRPAKHFGRDKHRR